MKLRPYQVDAVDATEAALTNGAKRSLIVAPTGTGKTQMFVELIRRYMPRGRCMVMAERGELIEQAVQRISQILGIFPAIEKADLSSHESAWCKPPIVVSSVQTMVSGEPGHRRFNRFNPHQFSLFICDEAHHATAASYRLVMDYFDVPECRAVGVTATPDRHDEQALGQIFDSVGYQMGMLDAIAAGWLVDVRQVPITIEGLDFSACRTTAGDLNGRDLDLVMSQEKTMLGVAGATLEQAGDRPTIVFAPSVLNAERLCEILNRYKPGSAAFVSGKSDKADRHERISGFREGRYQYLCNVALTTEGFDAPKTACIVMARPTKSRSLYEQMLGRGTRPLPGIVDGIDEDEERCVAIKASDKADLLVIDFVGNSGRHKLVNAFDVLGGEWDDEIAELAMRDARERGDPADVREALALAAKKAREEQQAAEAARRKHITPKVHYRTGQQVDPFDVFDINPWRMKLYEKGRMATPKQVAFLDKCGVKKAKELPMSHARQLITEIIQRRTDGLCTYKQAKLLQSKGLPGSVSFKQAGDWITAIANNHWQAPDHVRREAERHIEGSQ